MFRLNCHHQGADIDTAKTYSNKTLLQCLRISKCIDYIYIYSFKDENKTLITNSYEVMLVFVVYETLSNSFAKTRYQFFFTIMSALLLHTLLLCQIKILG
jgi:hypothetical protein